MMRHQLGISVLLMAAFGAPVAMADLITDTINFTGNGTIPTDGMFKYDTFANTFNSLTVTFDGQLFDRGMQRIGFLEAKARAKGFLQPAGEVAIGVGEAPRANDEIAHDQQRPAFADELERARDAAILPVAPRGHACHSSLVLL